MDDWLGDLVKPSLSCEHINSTPEVFAHQQTQARDRTVESNHAPTRTVKAVLPYKLSYIRAEIQKPSPLLGQNTEEVFTG